MTGLEIIDSKIYGRVKPRIYAFETKTVPNFLKVGDTYRPVWIRMEEWRKHYRNLQLLKDWEAKINANTYFRDHAVHEFLIDHGKRRATESDFSEGVYRSSEFFLGAQKEDVDAAIEDIHADFEKERHNYTFYNVEDHLPLTDGVYERNAPWKPRDNQKEVIKKFLKAKEEGRKNLLMYAVMRFGKSFTALCCAKAMEAHLVVVVSGKADVKEEWKKNVERPLLLEGYKFLTARDLTDNPAIISNSLAENQRLVVFLTLQDLQGRNIKERHRDLFQLNDAGKLDLLIVDESHFAARSDETGRVLKAASQDSHEDDGYDDTLDKLQEKTKHFTPSITLHLSGTPYRILMGGEFQKEDIIANVQYRDIIRARDEWDAKHLDTEEEWKNPYYGFPQMVRFAFNLNDSSRQLLQSMLDEGVEYGLDKLLEPVSTRYRRGSSDHKTFKYEEEVYDILAAIDGKKEDDNIFGFLDYPKIKEGGMCRHIVMVLPYRASCDAMQTLLETRAFNNLCDYAIINISGFESPQRYRGDTEQVIRDIEEFEKKGRKTISLTVGKMLTGSTVEQWDTMIFLRDTSSPQVYDQAIFRIQNKYLKTIKSSDGKEEIVQNMKPQTLLVDFDPTRMFVMQNQKTLITNMNEGIRGNEHLEEQLSEDLDVSPIIYLNRNQLKEVTAIDIIDSVRAYSKNRSLHDEAEDVPVDENIFYDEVLRDIIARQPEFDAKNGVFKQKPYMGEGDDIELPPTDINPSSPQPSTTTPQTEQEEKKSLFKRLKTYYFKILLFTYLTDKDVRTLSDIILAIQTDKDSQRIAYNIDLNLAGLIQIRERIHSAALYNLENRILNSQDLSKDKNADVKTALRQLNRLSSSEIVTPEDIAADMVNLFPADVTAGDRFLCFAGKTGEFEYALCQKYGDEVKPHIYTIPTSGVTYECTRKMFKLLGIPLDNILPFNTYDLIIAEKQQEIRDFLMAMKFKAAIGNPPYQEHDGGAGESSRPLYNEFVKYLNTLGLPYYTMIMPSRWMAGGKGLDEFREQMLNDVRISELHDFLHPETVFPHTNNRGGVCYFLWDSQYDNEVQLTNVVTHYSRHNIYPLRRPFRIEGLDIFLRNSRAFSILEKVQAVDKEHSIADHISAAKAFGLRTFFINDSRFKTSAQQCKQPIRCYGRAGRTGYVDREYITSHRNWIDAWKVFIPESNNIGTELADDNQNAFVGAPGTVCTETYLVVGADMNLDETSACNLCSYLRTKFARFMLSLAKNSQHGTSKTYRFVPLQDFSYTWTDDDLYKKYDLSPGEVKYIDSIIKPMS